ncbi:MAG: putative Ig domain-containing protein [Pontiellaceae bacterium]|nr:putative Ig domain-containing protein [Pontiellaceae bacterium]
MKKKEWFKLPRCGRGLMFGMALVILAGHAAAEFGAYYTKIDSGEAFEKVSRTGPYADIVVRDVGPDNGRLVFWRGSSYLPYWDVNGRKFFLDELTERSGDGPKERPDNVNTYSVVKIIESSPERAVIHWRYLPKFEGTNPHYNAVNAGDLTVKDPVDPARFVDEYFMLKPDGTLTRAFRRGTEKLDDWSNPESVTFHSCQLSGKGVVRSADSGDVSVLKEIMRLPASGKASVVAGNPVKSNSVAKPVANWRFDEGAGDITREEIGESLCAVAGGKTYWKKGISGTVLAFDGYHSVVRLPAESAPAITGSVTLEGWVAIGAYPWNWAPVIQQGHKESYYLGIGPHGHVRMCVNIDGQIYRVDSSAQLERRQWVHVAGTYEKRSGLLRVFVNGELSGETNAVSGDLSVSRAPVQIGQGKVMRPSDPVRASTFEGQFSFDGLIDEVRIYDDALSPTLIAKSYALLKPEPELCQNPDLEQRVLPAGLNTGKFGAYYTHLKFYDTWDGLFRFGAHPDVVVEFDKHPTRFVFWRGTCFIPMLVNELGEWYSNEFNETWSRSGGEGCMEPMSDKESFSNHAKIIENTPARAVIEWRYPLVDVKHTIANFDSMTGWGDWGDWCYTIYPDGVAVKEARVWSDCSSYHEFQEGMVITGPDQHPESVIEVDPALELTTLEGEVRRYSWTNGPPKNVNYSGVRAHEIQYKGEYDPFTIAGGVKTSGGVYSGEVTPYSVFPSWNHWPVAQMPSDGRYASFPDRTAHSSLTHFEGTEQDVWNSDTPYKRKLFLEGMSRMGPEELIKLTKSWAQAPGIQAVSGCEAIGYDQAKRDYPLVARDGQMTVRVNAHEEHPIVNICFSVKNWGHTGKADVKISGAEAADIRQGTFVDTDGTDTLVIWAELESVRPVEFTISGAKPDKKFTAPAAELCKPDTWGGWREPLKVRAPIAVRDPVAQWIGRYDVNERIKIKTREAIRRAKSMTWSVWMKTDTNGTLLSLLPDEGERWDKGAMILYLEGDELVLDVGWVGTAKFKAAELKDNQWHHIALTMLPVTVHFYLDGKLKQSAALMFKSAFPAERASFMNVGYPAYKVTPRFTGEMKSAAVYDYAMTDHQIFRLCKTGSPLPDPDQADAAPGILSRPGTDIEEDHPYIYTLTAQDPDGGEVVYSGIKIPAWLHFYSPSGVLRGTPRREDIGTHEVILQVSAGTQTVTQRFDIAVNELPKDAPHNLVLNGSFEFGGDTVMFWDLAKDMSVTTNKAAHGRRSLQVAGPCAPMKKTMAIETNTTYSISFWYNAEDLKAGTVVLDTDDVFDGDGQAQVVISSANSGWTQHKGTFNSGDHTSVVLRLFASENMAGTVYFDNIELSVEEK